MGNENLIEIPLNNLTESPTNPRKNFDKASLQELAQSIATDGVIQPIVVRPVSAGYEIVTGARRYRAAGMAGLATIPGVVRELDDIQVMRLQIIENLQRQDISPIEEASGYQALLAQDPQQDIKSIASEVGKSASYIYQRLKLCELIPEAQKLLNENSEFTAGHGILIARLAPDDQKEALRELDENRDWEEDRLPGVRFLQDWIKHELHLDLKKACFKPRDATLVPDAGACVYCLKCTGNEPELYSDIKDKNICTDRQCYKNKTQAFIDRIKQEYETKGITLLRLSDYYGPHMATKQQAKELKFSNSWTEVGKKTCKDTKQGIIELGHEVGKVLKVCTNPRCKTHHPGAQSDPAIQKLREDMKKEKAKRQLTEKVALRAVGKIADKAKTFNAQAQRITASCLVQQLHYDDSLDAICERRGWAPKTKSFGACQDILEKKIKTLPPAQLPGLILELALCNSIDEDGKNAPWKVLAKSYRIDPVKIKAEVVKETKAAAKQAPAKKRVNKNKKRGN